MPEPHELRASDAERERAAETLRGHAAAGRLDADELDERVGAALTARTRGELAALTADLPGPATPPAPRPATSRRAHAPRCHTKDPRSFVPIAVLLIAIWAVTGMGYFWPIWPIIGFAFAALPALVGNTRVIRSHGVHR